MPGVSRSTRRRVLTAIGAGITTTGASIGGGNSRETDDGDDEDSNRVSIRIHDCQTAAVWTRNPDAELVTAGLYFRETDRYEFHQSQVEFPYTLSLPQFDWARERDAVLTDVSVQDIDYDTLAAESVPDDWNCEENDFSPGCGRFDESP
ncbi:hypothetical protein [Haloterrigena alkaliphila]|uniref:Uncharacterized protein n=1 Tax=Haloterrigena alkaliphila TaxID=2816475 RepID=A0A8A2VKI8_9EURY|nr:hypothetical protein [Haloterrigena alkaliphila]QSX00905.1 hypothetical protein J0X25_08085 [Haloterrigena alkaliphila]